MLVFCKDVKLLFTVKLSVILTDPVPFALNSKSAFEIVVRIRLSSIAISFIRPVLKYRFLHAIELDPISYLAAKSGVRLLAICPIGVIVSNITSPN